jgi:hypothetical protein
MGIKERQQAAHVALEAAVARLGPLPMPQLAAEVMAQLKPDAPNVIAGAVTASQLVEGFVPDSQLLGLPAYEELRHQLLQLVLEGLQALEHASLICVEYEVRGIGHLCYLPNRRGLAALRDGTVEASVRANQPREPAW